MGQVADWGHPPADSRDYVPIADRHQIESPIYRPYSEVIKDENEDEGSDSDDNDEDEDNDEEEDE